MKTVSFQGTQLSASERRAVQLRQQVNSFMNPVLKQSVDAAIAENERKRAEQIPFDDPYRYRLDYSEKGTPFVGDAFGF